ncbi:hypothetical protein SAMN06265380_102159 [Ruegeria faecimaris]|uniref:Lipoprotein n=1 Tax=Ruegeria faecimaris TaxID=686389 RepID=A0A521C7V3_9RHOB|nr:hypothetical protein SAMN06265380_102159 [Ruegeria faecimaris]
MGLFSKPLLFAGALLILAACQTTTESTSPSNPPEIKRSSNAGPGANPVSAGQATAYFRALCGQAELGRSALEDAAAANGFVQNSKTTTYFHQKQDLSVKLTDTACSIVFVSNENPSTVNGTFNALQSDLGPISIRDVGVIGGEHYFSARIKV